MAFKDDIEKCIGSRPKFNKGGRSEHYLGEGVVNTVKKTYKGVRSGIDAAKSGVNNAKNLYRDTRELAGEAKRGIEHGKKMVSENIGHIKENIGGLKSKAGTVLKSAKKLIGRKKGGQPARVQKDVGGDIKRGFRKMACGLGPTTCNMAGGRKGLKKGGDSTCKGVSMKKGREEHFIGAAVGPALSAASKLAVPAAKFIAPHLIGYGISKMLTRKKKDEKRPEHYEGGKIKELRTSIKATGPFRKMKDLPKERAERAPGGVGKLRKDQYY